MRKSIELGFGRGEATFKQVVSAYPFLASFCFSDYILWPEQYEYGQAREEWANGEKKSFVRFRKELLEAEAFVTALAPLTRFFLQPTNKYNLKEDLYSLRPAFEHIVGYVGHGELLTAYLMSGIHVKIIPDRDRSVGHRVIGNITSRSYNAFLDMSYDFYNKTEFKRGVPPVRDLFTALRFKMDTLDLKTLGEPPKSQSGESELSTDFSTLL